MADDKTNPFNYVNSVMYSKENLMMATDEPELMEAKYSPFIVNRALANFLDTVLFANEMNIKHTADHKMQYDFFLHGIPPKKRFAKWAKATKSESIELIKKAYGYSSEKAAQVVDLFTSEQLEQLKQNTGGTKNDRRAN